MQTQNAAGTITKSAKPSYARDFHLNEAKSKQVSSEQITGKFNPPFGVESRVVGYLTTPPFGPNPNKEANKQ